MNKFGAEVRRLRNAKGYSLRTLGPLVNVGFTYLSKIESGKLDFGDAPSAELIIRLAETLDADADKLLLLAGRVPDSIANRIAEQPEVFLFLAKCSDRQLRQLVSQAESARSN